MNSIKNTPFPSMTPVVGVVVLCLQSITAIEYFRKLVKSTKNIVESATDFMKFPNISPAEASFSLTAYIFTPTNSIMYAIRFQKTCVICALCTIIQSKNRLSENCGYGVSIYLSSTYFKNNNPSLFRNLPFKGTPINYIDIQ